MGLSCLTSTRPYAIKCAKWPGIVAVVTVFAGLMVPQPAMLAQRSTVKRASGFVARPAEGAARLPPGGRSQWPSVAALISTYERAEYLIEALQQISAQRYPGRLEAVVVDDSETDLEPRLQKLRQKSDGFMPQVTYIYLKDRMSIGAKRNLAARSTDADVLCVWDDDDVFTMDRIQSQVEHLFSGPGVSSPNCSAIEISSIFSVPDQDMQLSLRPTHLPQVVYENTLCFPKSWWESSKWSFGEAWEVSGQGEGTLEPWWKEVRPLPGTQEPFLYVYLPSSVSGGIPRNLDPHPAPDERLWALVRALHPSGRFPDHLPGHHVRGAIEGARACLRRMLDDPDLLSDSSLEPLDFEAFRERYGPVRQRWISQRQQQQ
eukprot:TRINITY_DN63490_c0_g1_i1.p1 TRINITY_DN63490_c0_g1~~TRINITY_DN63490_c0_g1_i1.p1  ORF type:complete len:384 (-),score=49.35 TRINITY_DN63490_c0_g1_i1:8-1129(-)